MEIERVLTLLLLGAGLAFFWVSVWMFKKALDEYMLAKIQRAELEHLYESLLTMKGNGKDQ